MDSPIKNKSCQTKRCKIPQKNINQNGKGDKPRPFSKNQYNKNYESINWKR